jgi:nuclear protein localization family protein 4
VLKINQECRPSSDQGLFLRSNKQQEVLPHTLDVHLSEIPLRHGDMIYLEQKVTSASVDSGVYVSHGNVEEDEIDKRLKKKDGKIHRKKDPQLCHHGDNNKCLNCTPLEPFDVKYLESRDPPIKFLSIHSYFRKLTSGIDKGKFVSLEDLSCRIKPGCTDHPPWPEGICTKCQPSAITLARQTYRHIDNIMFEDGKIVDRFLNGWRKSGRQRIGFMYGHLEEYTDVPLGIKGVVSVIYEPPQISSPLSVELIASQDEEDSVEQIARVLGLQKVGYPSLSLTSQCMLSLCVLQLGWIFTDLESQKNSKVAHKRHIDTFFLSAQECITAAHLQNKHPSPCQYSPNGYFGSKFVTVCVSGDEHNDIHLTGYQVSNQCMALVRDGCLVPTVDVPELGYVKDSSQEQYVPDVFYKSKDEYGNEVTKLARPLPVEYLLVELTISTPKEPCPTLPGGKNGEPFPIANREFGGVKPDFHQLANYIRQQYMKDFYYTMSDFQVLLYLYRCDIVPMKEATLELCGLIKAGDIPGIGKWRLKEPWSTIEQLIRATEQSPEIGKGPPTYPVVTGNTWTCNHCTFLNKSEAQVCEMCQLPRN